MRLVNLDTWPRREQFNTFGAWDHPHFAMCANVDVTAFYPLVKQMGASFTVATVYMLARAANSIPEFRYRTRPGGVVEHEIVHTSTTILTKEELFSFCTIEYAEHFSSFATRAAAQIAHVQEHPTLQNEPGRDDLLFMAAIPWVSFTSFMHPLHLHPADSVPRFARGKSFEEGGSLRMPLSVQGYHALMDGLHIGKFYEELQGYLRNAGPILDEWSGRSLATRWSDPSQQRRTGKCGSECGWPGSFPHRNAGTFGHKEQELRPAQYAGSR